jgi:hypothetical protein
VLNSTVFEPEDASVPWADQAAIGEITLPQRRRQVGAEPSKYSDLRALANNNHVDAVDAAPSRHILIEVG